MSRDSKLLLPTIQATELCTIHSLHTAMHTAELQREFKVSGFKPFVTESQERELPAKWYNSWQDTLSLNRIGIGAG